MDSSKQTFKYLGLMAVFSFFVLFPFGQVLKWQFIVSDYRISVLPIDIVAGLTLIFFPFIDKPHLKRSFRAFFFILLFSVVFSLTKFTFSQVILGSMYLFRLLAYYSLFVLTWNLLDKKVLNKSVLYKTFLYSILFVVFLGWVQYIYFPDLTSLRFIGWDDHLFRLVGTFLDPGFTGIILVIGALSFYVKFLKTRKISSLTVLVFLILTIAFTYSRAAYLSFIVGIFAIPGPVKRHLKTSLLIFLVFVVIVLFLPRPRGEGVHLERTASINARFENYEQTFAIFRRNPLFGVGFNNICWEKVRIFKLDSGSHSCGGSDSSILLLIATGGTLGLMSFLYLVRETGKQLKNGFYKDLLVSAALAVFVNSFFINSLFYSWILGILAVLYALALKEKKKL